MRWDEFAEAAPELARLGAERLDRSELALVGTLRRDGSPRISPVEPYIVTGELLLGMMPESRKALDLLRDPRMVVHSTVSDREGTEGDFKLYGRAVDVRDPALREAYADATEARIDWRPTGPYHLFSVDVESAGFVVFQPEAYGMRWTQDTGLHRFPMRTE
jgi:pyridoxamine 5'-phosphate oxidase-like protein